MEEFTLLELEVDELSLTNAAPLIGRAGERPADEDTAAGAAEDGTDEDAGAAGVGGPRRLLLAVALLAVLVVVAKALSGDEELDDLAEIDADADA